jgi:DNA-binding protein WhiA
MAFSTEMREELSRVPCEKQCCALAEIAGWLACGGLSYRGQNKYGLEIHTESAQGARRYFTMCRRWLNAGSEIRIAKTRQLGEHVSYTLTPADEDIPGMLAALDLTDEDEPFGMRSTLPGRCCARNAAGRVSARRNLAGGSVNNPE